MTGMPVVLQDSGCGGVGGWTSLMAVQDVIGAGVVAGVATP